MLYWWQALVYEYIPFVEIVQTNQLNLNRKILRNVTRLDLVLGAVSLNLRMGFFFVGVAGV